MFRAARCVNKDRRHGRWLELDPMIPPKSLDVGFADVEELTGKVVQPYMAIGLLACTFCSMLANIHLPTLSA